MKRVSARRAQIDFGAADTVKAASPRVHPGSVWSTNFAARLTTGRISRPLTVAGWLSFGLGIVVLCGQFWQGVNPQDEGELLTYPWLIASGRVPYTQIWMMYPPSTFMALAGLFKLGIPGFLAERGLGLIARLCFVLLVNRALTGAWRRFSWFGVPISFALMFLAANIGLAAYAWVVGLPVLLAALLCMRAGRFGWSVLAFAAAGTFRLEFGVAGLAGLVALAVLDWIRGQRDHRVWRPAIALAVCLLGFYLILDLVTAGRALSETVIDPVLHIEPYRRIPLYPPRFGLFGVPAALVLFVGPPLLVALGVSLRNWVLAATNVAICALLPQVLQDADWGHLFGVAAVGVPWVIVSLVDVYHAFSDPGPVARVQRRPIAAARRLFLTVFFSAMAIVGTVYSLFVVAYAVVASPLSPASASYIGRGLSHVVGSGRHMIVARSNAEARDGSAVLAFLNAHHRNHETIYVSPSALFGANYNMTALYYALGIAPASIYLETNPGVQTNPAVQRVIKSELNACTWIVLWKDSAQPKVSAPGEDAIQRYLTANFLTVMSNDTYDVLRRR